MRILITNNTLASRAGSELYVRDLAIALLKRGHTPIAYSTVLGEVANEIRVATVPVIDSLDALSIPPDIIHGQHHLETMTALLRFPNVPAVYFCHGWLPWEEAPPRFPRILKYVAIDQACRDRLLLEHAIPEDKIELLLNFVDLERFQPRVKPLPARPQRALIFSNYAKDSGTTAAIREACTRHGIELSVVGLGTGIGSAQPEAVLGNYDLIFARGRSALEALAIGAAVIVTGIQRTGPMVTLAEYEELRLLNFGLRAFRKPITTDAISRQIARYDPVDAATVTERIRADAGLDNAVDRILGLYNEVIAEHSNSKTQWTEEAQATSAYLRWLSPSYKAALKASAESAQKMLGEKELQLHRITHTLADREQQLQRITNTLSWRLINQYGPIKHRLVRPAYQGFKNLFKSKNGTKL